MLTYWQKRLLSKLPPRIQQELKRLRFGRQIRSGRFITDEPEYRQLETWVREGDWVIDAGANVGHYTLRLSQLVGRDGRVLAFEPVPETFELLAANTAAAGTRNVSLFNVALSADIGVQAMSIPYFTSGLPNYYMATLSGAGGGLDVLAVTMDCLLPPRHVSFIKIDVEGHEIQTLRGMERLLRRDRPRLVIEGATKEVRAFLRELHYDLTRLPDSPNTIFLPVDVR